MAQKSQKGRVKTVKDKIRTYLDAPEDKHYKDEPSKRDKNRITGYIEELKKSNPSYLDDIQAIIEKKEEGSCNIRHANVLNWIKKAKGEPLDYRQEQPREKDSVRAMTLPEKVSQQQPETGTVDIVDAKPAPVEQKVHGKPEPLGLPNKLFDLCRDLRTNPEDSALQSEFLEACNQHTEIIKQNFLLNSDICSMATCLLVVRLSKENEEKLLPCFNKFSWLDKLLLDYQMIFPKLSDWTKEQTLRMILKDNLERALEVVLPLYDKYPNHQNIIDETVFSSLDEKGLLAKVQTIENKETRRNAFLASALLPHISNTLIREKCLQAQMDFLNGILGERQLLNNKIAGLEGKLRSERNELGKRRKEISDRDRNIRNLADEKGEMSKRLQAETEATRQLRSEIEELRMTILHIERKVDEASGIVKRIVYDKLSQILEFVEDVPLLGFNSDQINWSENNIIGPIRQLYDEYGKELGLI